MKTQKFGIVGVPNVTVTMFNDEGEVNEASERAFHDNKDTDPLGRNICVDPVSVFQDHPKCPTVAAMKRHLKNSALRRLRAFSDHRFFPVEQQ